MLLHRDSGGTVGMVLAVCLGRLNGVAARWNRGLMVGSNSVHGGG